MCSRIRVVIADDHTLLRQGTAELLRHQPSLDIVGEACDGQQVIELTRNLSPDVVVMDVQMPILSGLEAARRIHQLMPNVKVLMLSAFDDDQYVFSALLAGASGYILKTAPIHELVTAIHQARNGEWPLDSSIDRRISAHGSLPLHQQAASTGQSGEELRLTGREREVLGLLAKGLTNREIGQALFISGRTVQVHLGNIFAKLHVTSRLDAVVTAIRQGLLAVDQHP